MVGIYRVLFRALCILCILGQGSKQNYPSGAWCCEMNATETPDLPPVVGYSRRSTIRLVEGVC